MNRNYKYLFVSFIGLVLLIFGVVLSLQATKKNDSNENNDTFKILDGELPLCSREHLLPDNDANANSNIVFTNENYEIDKDGNRLNNSSILKQQHTYNGISIENMRITSKKCYEITASFEFQITNNTGSDIINKYLKFNFLDKKNNSKFVAYVYIEEKIENGKTQKILSEDWTGRIIDSYDYNVILLDEYDGGEAYK